MQTQKEILRDTILTQMRPFLDSVTLEMLNNVIVESLFNVDVVEMETLPATRETTNEYILELYMMKKVPKLSKQTAKYYLLTINHFIEFTGKSLLNVTDMDVEYYLHNYAKKGNTETTVNNERRNLSAFFSWMRKSHLISENPVDNVEKWTEVEKPIDYLRDWEFEALRDACKRQKGEKIKDINAYREALRDRALLEFLRSTAIRVGECVSVNISDIDWNNGEVLVYGHKTKRYRKACIDDVAKYHLKKYIDSRTDDNEALFVSLKSPHRRMQKTSIEYAIRSIADRSILGRRVYPHLLRKTTATNMAKRGCPRELIAFYLGHKDGNTKTLNKHYASTDPAQITAAFWRYGAAA
ncbi:MAG: tyrosine-type recombinase/integrase [Lachnospiraceae bacterium]